MRNMLIALIVLATISLMVSDAHAYRIRTIIKSNDVPYTWTSQY